MILTDFIKNTGIGTSGKTLEQLQAVLNRYCQSVARSSWDADDLAQDTWLKVIGTGKGLLHANPEALLMRVAKNTWIDQSRRKTVLARILKGERPKVTQPEHAGSFEIEMAFQALVKHLSPLQRTVFILRDVFEYSSVETAELLGTTEGAVKAALHRARRSLDAVREDLEKDALPLPQEEGLKAFVEAFAAAYQMGDIVRLVELAQREEGKVTTDQPTMQMAA